MRGLFVLGTAAFELIYGPEELHDIDSMLDICALPNTADAVANKPEMLEDINVIVSGWGGPRIDRAFLDAAPRLKMVFYGAGSIKGIVTDEFWERNVRITSAYAANAEPVAEYALSQILFCLKHGWKYALTIREQGAFPEQTPVPGAYGSTVGIVSLGMIGRRVRELLQSFDLNVVAYDPFVAENEAAALGVELCSLEDVFARADVVSLHTPWLKETEGLISAAHFSSMKPGASFINTARGAIVRQDEMVGVLEQRPDLWAVLDVTYPEPPEPGSRLYSLPNVVLTPHIAGSMNGECRRMGRYMVDELRRYIAGEPLLWEITREKAGRMA